VEAARIASQPGLELLFQCGADLNAVWRGYRPLHALIQEEPHAFSGHPSPDRLSCLKWLLENGADPERPAGWPPARAVITAAFVGEQAYVDGLRGGGINMDGFAAAAIGDIRLVGKALRQRPALATERDIGGLTALQCAAGSQMPGANAVEVARILLEAGADPRARTKSWSHEIDATYLAASAKNAALFALLLEAGVDATEALVPALWNGTEDMAKAAIEHGAKPDQASADGQPLLNNLIRWGQVRQALWLLDRGANPNIPDDRGWTAVHQVASRGNERLLKAVMGAGGNLRSRDKEGRTPKDVAGGPKRDRVVAVLASADG
jgi:ankyrin repeat protein